MWFHRLLTVPVRLLWAAIVIATPAACTYGPGIVAVPELDNEVLGIGDNNSSPFVGRTRADVLRQVGEPADKRHYPTGEDWAYPVRAFSPRDFPPAAILRIEFTLAGVVSDWYFFNSRTKARLPIRETYTDARRFLARVCGRPVGEVNLEAGIRRNQSSKADIAALLAPVVGGRHFSRAHVRETITASGFVWDYYVDRPSPVFIPPFYVIVVFGDEGVVKLIYPEGYGGCI
jgi:hypothetical protein